MDPDRLGSERSARGVHGLIEVVRGPVWLVQRWSINWPRCRVRLEASASNLTSVRAFRSRQARSGTGSPSTVAENLPSSLTSMATGQRVRRCKGAAKGTESALADASAQ